MIDLFMVFIWTWLEIREYLYGDRMCNCTIIRTGGMVLWKMERKRKANRSIVTYGSPCWKQRGLISSYGKCSGGRKNSDLWKEEHTHDDSCYESVLICTEEAEEHEHDDSCYEDKLICERKNTPMTIAAIPSRHLPILRTRSRRMKVRTIQRWQETALSRLHRKKLKPQRRNQKK